MRRLRPFTNHTALPGRMLPSSSLRFRGQDAGRSQERRPCNTREGTAGNFTGLAPGSWRCLHRVQEPTASDSCSYRPPTTSSVSTAQRQARSYKQLPLRSTAGAILRCVVDAWRLFGDSYSVSLIWPGLHGRSPKFGSPGIEKPRTAGTKIIVLKLLSLNA